MIFTFISCPNRKKLCIFGRCRKLLGTSVRFNLPIHGLFRHYPNTMVNNKEIKESLCQLHLLFGYF